MKNIFPTLLLLLFALYGFGQKYTIRGTLTDDAFEGKYILLTKAYFHLFETPVILDSVKVKNRKFCFKGKIKSKPFLVKLSFSDQSAIGNFFILEPGKINVSVFRTSYNEYNAHVLNVSGTPLNDEYNSEMILPSQVAAMADSVSAKRNKVYREGGTWSEDEELNYQNKVPTKLIALAWEKRWNYLEKHIQYPEIIFYDLAPNSSSPKRQKIFAQLPEELQKRIEHYQDTLKELTAQFQKEGKLQLPQVKYIENTPQAVQTGQPYVDFTGITPEGKTVILSEVVKSNKLVLLDFWASWCAPCMKSMPEIAALYKQYKNKGLEIIGISSDQSVQRWNDAIRKQNMDWLQIRSSGEEDKIGKVYSIKFIPYTILIGHDGKIVARRLKGDELVKKVKEILE